MNYSFNAFRILSSALVHKQNVSSPSNIITLMYCVIFARITHVKVCSVKYSCPLVFSYKNEGGEEQGRNPVKFGCVVGGGRLRRRSRSREEKDFHKVEMENGGPKKRKKGEKGKHHTGAISWLLLPALHTVSVKSVLLCCSVCGCWSRQSSCILCPIP